MIKEGLKMDGITGGTLYALLKFFLGHTVAASLAAAVGFLIIKPRSGHEALLRILASLLFSFILGPMFVAYVHHLAPWMFEEAIKQAARDGLAPFSEIYVTWPLVVISGLPAWWVLGWIFKYLDARKDKDLLDVAAEAKDKLK